MMMDAQNTFSDGQALTATAVSTNVIAFSSAVDLGAGNVPRLDVNVTAKGGTNPTLVVALIGGATVDGNGAIEATGKITIASTGTLAAPLGRVGLAIPSHAPKKFYCLSYTLDGTNPTFTVDAGLVLDQQTAG